MLYTRHKTFCILSPLIPKFRVRKGKKNLSEELARMWSSRVEVEHFIRVGSLIISVNENF